jgi:hypothetical protein
MAKAALGGTEIDVDEDGFIRGGRSRQDGECFSHERGALEAGQLPSRLLSEIWNCPAHPYGGKANWIRFEKDLSVVPGRSGEGSL